MPRHFYIISYIVSRRMYCLTLVAVGDNVSKKTELLAKYTGQDNCINLKNVLEEVIVDHTRYLVHFIDAESSNSYSILRKTAIEKADCVMLCYSVVHRNSFDDLLSKWCMEVREYNINTPIVLVGTEVENRKSNCKSCVSRKEGETLKKLIGAFSFVECSIDTFVGVDDVFIEAIRSVISRYCFLKPLIKMK